MIAGHESRSAAIRSKLTHPIIDADGHMSESEVDKWRAA
jgi:hypothetical protein